MANKKNEDWIAEINQKKRFWGVIVDFYEEMCIDNGWNAERTKSNYLADYKRRIIPFIEDHNSRPIDSFTPDQFREIISSIKQTRKYSESRILHFMRLIDAVVRVANKHKLCEDLLKGTAFELPLKLDAQAKIRELVTLKQSFSPEQEVKIYLKLTQDVSMNGELFGVYLMFVFGVRNGEAAAITFSDLITSYTEDGFHVLMVYKTIESKEHRMVSSGKTRNADRIIPIPEEVYSFLMKRRQYIADQTGKSLNEVDSLPIACVGTDYEKHCYPEQIGQAAKTLFFEVGIESDVLAYLDYEIMKGEDPVIVKEKEPTSYLMRRNFGTQMVIICMKESEIQFLLGHDITDAYETRNEKVCFKDLKEMSIKMNERGIFNRKAERIDIPHLDYNTEIKINTDSITHLEIGLEENDILQLRISSAEPNGRIGVKIASEEDYQIEKTEYRTPPNYPNDRTINILDSYHKTYKNKKKN